MTALFLLIAFLGAADDAPYDIVIRSGRVVDGTGNPWFRADVGIRGDRIITVGSIPSAAKSARAIDASGLIVAPGFIDIHSHSDWLLFEDGSAPAKVRQGVTTEVLGEDSSGGPNWGKRSPKTIDVRGRPVSIATLADYLGALEQSGIAVNVATYAGLGNIWGCVMGDSFDRPTLAQLEAMKLFLDEALRDGAFGLSTMLAAPQELIATTDDIVALCAVVKRHGGSYSSHIRNEGEDVVAAVKEAISIGESAGVPVDIIHLKIADQRLWGRMQTLVDLIDQARARGVDVRANVYPYTRGNNDLVSIIPPWAHEGGRDAMLARLRDPAERARMKGDIRSGLPGWYNHLLAVGGDWSRMLISARLSEPNRSLEGLTVDRVFAAKAKGQATAPDALDQLFDFLVEEGGSVGTIYAHHTEEDMTRAMAQPWCSIGSDGSAFAVEGSLRRGHPHPRSFGTFPRVLGVYVREQHLLRLEDAVRKMTGLNAAKLGMVDRGLVRPGQFADLVLFDPDKVMDRATYLEPFQYPNGIALVVVNGKVVLEHGQPTDARPGRGLRH
jgi:N-acyl-D-aspartate/D-glutamate deacylase